MLFNSYQFIIFFALFFALYVCLSHKNQNLLILLASCIFYGAWDWRFLGLLGFTIGVDYLVARRLDSETAPTRRRALLSASLFANLGMLAFFKYFDFFVVNLNELLATTGVQFPLPVLHVILPVGISFYTLHTLGYVLDVYHRRQAHVSSLMEFACFVAFFPLLVAGPIVRIAYMRGQFSSPRTIKIENIRSGLSLCLIGLFQKVVIADNLAVVADRIFSDISHYGSLELLIGLYAFAFQIYGDFAGYSNIAIGLATILGFSIPANFDRPYAATSIRDFWRRWHISLSTWIRDYLYIPLGGSRTGHRYRNLLVTMGICGLWHGASWNMVIWGLYHGGLLGAQHGLSSFTPALQAQWPTGTRWIFAAISPFITFHLVCLGWLLFRSPNLSDALHYAKGMLSVHAQAPIQMASLLAIGFMIAAIALDTLHSFAERPDFFVSWPAILRGTAIGVMVGALFVFGGFTDVPFIYFQF